jgi:hypothetical protein
MGAAAIPFAIMAGGQAIQSIGGYSAADDQAKSLRSQAKTDEQNARLARLQGSDASALEQRKMNQFAATQRAALAQSGIGASTGTGASIVAESQRAMELDQITNLYKTELEAQGYEAAARAKRSTAKGVKQGAALGLFGGALSAAGTYTAGTYKPKTPEMGR